MLARAASAPTPTFTFTPALRNVRKPNPAVRGSGSSMAATTRAIPASAMLVEQVGPRLLACAQGSRVA